MKKATARSSGWRVSDFVCRIARDRGERAAYYQLRRDIFCAEQGLFAERDDDPLDVSAFPIVCVDQRSGTVVGVVRLWEERPGVFWGGRLGVHAAYRTEGSIGRRLIQHAVGTARAWGAERFYATVQRANVPFFRRLHWRSLEELEIRGWAHHLMEAALDRYASTDEPRPPLASSHEAA